MERQTQKQEPMNQMSLGVNQFPFNTIQNYQYFIPEYHNIPNIPQMAMYANHQQMNRYFYPVESPREKPSYPPNPGPKVHNAPRPSSSNQSPSEKQKIKPYINLLITSVNKLFSEGKITMKYLNEKTEHKSNHGNNNKASTHSTNSSTTNNINIYTKNFSDNSAINNVNTTKKINSKKHQNGGGANDIKNQKQNHSNDKCENDFCENVFNSNKEKYKTKIKGLKVQEKNLCKSCSSALEEGNFCYYCNVIYRDGLRDPKNWVECDFCRGWEHINCEIEKGKKYKEVKDLIEEKHYMCPICVNKRNNQKNIENKIQKKLINKKRRGDVFDDQKNKKNQRKDLRNLKSEKCSELLEDIELIEQFTKL